MACPALQHLLLPLSLAMSPLTLPCYAHCLLCLTVPPMPLLVHLTTSQLLYEPMTAIHIYSAQKAYSTAMHGKKPSSGNFWFWFAFETRSSMLLWLFRDYV